MTGFTNRQQLLSKMRNGEHLDWDIIVIGGGITGAGVLREARRHGYRALLVEQQDF
jgi:glycerol-3-phosphate dehydrogenase